MAVLTPEALGEVTRPTPPPRRRALTPGSAAAQVFMILAVVLWITPILFALYVGLRPRKGTDRLGYVSLPHSLTFQNFTTAWTQSDMGRFFLNSVWIPVPAVIITLVMASAVAFVVSRLSFKFNIALLILFTAGNLLPQQVIITPLYRLYLQIHLPHFISGSGLLYDSRLG